MSMINHLTSEVLFDPVYEFHDQHKLAVESKSMYGVKAGTIMRSEIEATATNAALTVWLELWTIIKQIEDDDDASAEIVW